MTEENNSPKKKGFFESWTFVIVVCIIMPICFRAVLYSPRHIPSSSMKSTLLIGDYIFISKFAYGYSKYSLPLGYKFNYFNGRIWEKEPVRGDIIVFRPPNDTSTDFIKRLIGLPGDTIQMKKGKLYLNGVLLPNKRIEDFLDKREDGSAMVVKRYIEKLPNGVSYEVLDEIESGPADDTEIFTVPSGHYFFVGDNRDNSADSRLTLGYVPFENLIGRAETVFFSNESRFLNIFKWLVSFRKERFLIDLEKNHQ